MRNEKVQVREDESNQAELFLDKRRRRMRETPVMGCLQYGYRSNGDGVCWNVLFLEVWGSEAERAWASFDRVT